MTTHDNSWSQHHWEALGKADRIAAEIVAVKKEQREEIDQTNLSTMLRLGCATESDPNDKFAGKKYELRKRIAQLESEKLSADERIQEISENRQSFVNAEHERLEQHHTKSKKEIKEKRDAAKKIEKQAIELMQATRCQAPIGGQSGVDKWFDDRRKAKELAGKAVRMKQTLHLTEDLDRKNELDRDIKEQHKLTKEIEDLKLKQANIGLKIRTWGREADVTSLTAKGDLGLILNLKCRVRKIAEFEVKKKETARDIQNKKNALDKVNEKLGLLNSRDQSPSTESSIVSESSSVEVEGPAITQGGILPPNPRPTAGRRLAHHSQNSDSTMLLWGSALAFVILLCYLWRRFSASRKAN